MKDELINIANILIKSVDRNKKDVLKCFIDSIQNDEINTARIIADEFSDFCNEKDNLTSLTKRTVRLSSELYDKTMEYYESKY